MSFKIIDKGYKTIIYDEIALNIGIYDDYIELLGEQINIHYNNKEYKFGNFVEFENELQKIKMWEQEKAENKMLNDKLNKIKNLSFVNKCKFLFNMLDI